MTQSTPKLSYPPVEISEEGVDDKISKAVKLVLDFLKSHGLDKSNPLALLCFGMVARSVLSLFIGDDLSMMVTVLMAIAAWHFHSEKKREIKGEMDYTKEAKSNIEKELKDSKREKMQILKDSLTPGKRPDPKEEHRRLHPELYSVMDDVDGVIVPPRRSSRKKKLWNPKARPKATRTKKEDDGFL